MSEPRERDELAPTGVPCPKCGDARAGVDAPEALHHCLACHHVWDEFERLRAELVRLRALAALADAAVEACEWCDRHERFATYRSREGGSTVCDLHLEKARRQFAGIDHWDEVIYAEAARAANAVIEAEQVEGGGR